MLLRRQLEKSGCAQEDNSRANGWRFACKEMEAYWYFANYLKSTPCRKRKLGKGSDSNANLHQINNYRPGPRREIVWVSDDELFSLDNFECGVKACWNSGLAAANAVGFVTHYPPDRRTLAFAIAECAKSNLETSSVRLPMQILLTSSLPEVK